jgi:Ni,Fe-hydrogenase I cytochrome b subunit
METKKYTLEELTGRTPRTRTVACSLIGLLCIAVGTMLPILNVYQGAFHVGSWWKFVYAAGAILYLVGKVATVYTGTHLRIRRLHRIEAWSAIFFCVAAALLFYNGSYTRDSWAFTLAGGILLIYTNIAIPRTITKALKNNEKI